jgi:hypothetical protein
MSSAGRTLGEAPLDVVPRGGVGPPNAATCAGCGAPLAADQRYCLACGRPCSPVRLAFLDVLQAERPAAAPPLGGPYLNGYAPPPEPDGTLGALRRYSGLFGLLAVLLTSLLIGLLVGHWLTGGTGGTAGGKQVFEVKGLGALAAAPAAPSSTGAGGSTGSGSSSSPAGHGTPSGHGSTTGSSPSSSAKSEEAEEAKELKTTTKPLPAARPTSSSALQKISHTTGKQHAKEVAARGDAPRETH